VNRDWLDKDFYKILGVSQSASIDDIKKSYKKLARENHPDLNPGDSEAEKRFKDISEASSVLTDQKNVKNMIRFEQWVPLHLVDKEALMSTT
jgi:molecular chaperone DnaJ